MTGETRAQADSGVPVIDLSQAPGAVEGLRRSKLVTFSWHLVEYFLVANRLQISSRLRAAALRWYGARIGHGVIMRPGLRVKSPWNLAVGDRCWIGDGVWLHNRDRITIGSDVVISQETYMTTGAHAFRTNMALITKPIVIEDGVWVSSRCVVLGGAHIGRSAVLSPTTVAKGSIAANTIVSSPAPVVVGQRFDLSSSS
ncbi:acetyltransferase [Leifsonia sp. Leaf264]|uniref:acetyltransferase n=1 Tax=Leifsonia sp. Leaf264 TaxID=1736314 RepID=UPI0006FDA8FC|nr:acetyltransferase [Leifsonia sp. Leaf264]KQO97540.1 acetyltransferase [Leifsonia sp. Leaf264]